MTSDEGLKIMAAKGLAEHLASRVNEFMSGASADMRQRLQTIGGRAELDYSEKSLDLLNVVITFLLGQPESTLGRLLLDNTRFIPASERVDYWLSAGYFYAAEVAVRCLGAQWIEKKGLFSKPQLGLRLPDGTFYSEAEIRFRKSELPKDSYLRLKSRIKRLDLTKVELE